jgi:hypothetical protein
MPADLLPSRQSVVVCLFACILLFGFNGQMSRSKAEPKCPVEICWLLVDVQRPNAVAKVTRLQRYKMPSREALNRVMSRTNYGST